MCARLGHRIVSIPYLSQVEMYFLLKMLQGKCNLPAYVAMSLYRKGYIFSPVFIGYKQITANYFAAYYKCLPNLRGRILKHYFGSVRCLS